MKEVVTTHAVAWIALVVALVIAAPPACADTAAARIEQAARAVLLEQARAAGLARPAVDIKVVPRGEAPQCPTQETIEPIDTRQASRMRFAVVCHTEPSMHTEFIVRGSITAEVVVITSDVKANRPIDATQLALAQREVPAGAQVLSALERVAGKSSRRALRNGQIIDARWLLEPVLVERGANLTILARKAGVQVSVAGVATEKGRRGDIISVRNNATGKVIRARVTAENMVEPAEVSMPASQ